MRIRDFLKDFLASWKISRELSNESERRMMYAAGVGSGFAAAGGIGLGVASVTAVPAVAIAGLCAAPLVPFGALTAAWMWRKRLKRTFPGMPILQYLEARELYRTQYEQELADIQILRLPDGEAQRYRLEAFQRYRQRLDRLEAVRLGTGEGTSGSSNFPPQLPPGG